MKKGREGIHVHRNHPATDRTVIASKIDPALPELVERAGGAARFAWDEFFYAEHHNPHTQKAYMAAVRRFLGWCEGQGVELAGDHAGHGRAIPRRPGRLGRQAEPAPVGVAGLLRPAGASGMWCILNPAASVQWRQGTVIEGKTPEITIEQARTLLASIRLRTR